MDEQSELSGQWQISDAETMSKEGASVHAEIIAYSREQHSLCSSSNRMESRPKLGHCVARTYIAQLETLIQNRMKNQFFF